MDIGMCPDMAGAVLSAGHSASVSVLRGGRDHRQFGRCELPGPRQDGQIARSKLVKRAAGGTGSGPGAASNSRTNEPAAGEIPLIRRNDSRVGWASGTTHAARTHELRNPDVSGVPAVGAPRGVRRWAGRSVYLSFDSSLHG